MTGRKSRPSSFQTVLGRSFRCCSTSSTSESSRPLSTTSAGSSCSRTASTSPSRSQTTFSKRSNSPCRPFTHSPGEATTKWTRGRAISLRRSWGSLRQSPACPSSSPRFPPWSWSSRRCRTLRVFVRFCHSFCHSFCHLFKCPRVLFYKTLRIPI